METPSGTQVECELPFYHQRKSSACSLHSGPWLEGWAELASSLPGNSGAVGSRAGSRGRTVSWGGAMCLSAHLQCRTSRCFPDLTLQLGINSQPTAQNYLFTGEVTYFRSSSDLHLFVPLCSFLQKHGPHAGQHGRTRDFGTGGKGATGVLSCRWRGACEGCAQRCLRLLLVGRRWFCFDTS